MGTLENWHDSSFVIHGRKDGWVQMLYSSSWRWQQFSAEQLLPKKPVQPTLCHSEKHWSTQSDSMGLLKQWRGLPCVILVMTVGRIHFLYTRRSEKLDVPGVAAEQPLPGQGIRTALQSFHHNTNHTCTFHSPPDKLGKTPDRANPIAFGLLVTKNTCLSPSTCWTRRRSGRCSNLWPLCL